MNEIDDTLVQRVSRALEERGWKCNSWFDRKNQNLCLSARQENYNLIMLVKKGRESA
jgi:hypothetical protein